MKMKKKQEMGNFHTLFVQLSMDKGNKKIRIKYLTDLKSLILLVNKVTNAQRLRSTKIPT